MKSKIKQFFLLFCITPFIALLTIACVSENSQFQDLPLISTESKNPNNPVSESNLLNSNNLKKDEKKTSNSSDSNLNSSKQESKPNDSKLDVKPESSLKPSDNKTIETIPPSSTNPKTTQPLNPTENVPEINEKKPESTESEPKINLEDTPTPIAQKSDHDLLNKINSIIQVIFKNNTEKENTIKIVDAFFERLKTGESSTKPIKYVPYVQLLKDKVANTLIKNTLNIDNDSNFLDVSELIKNVDYNLDNFSFSSLQENSSIKNIYNDNLDFFKKFIAASSGLTPNPGPLGFRVWEKRVAWPSLQYGIAYKLNNVDKRSAASTRGPDSTLNADFNLEQSILQKDKLIINKIIYITNQIFATLFKHYKSFLKETDENQKQLELSKMFVLLQALFYGKNAKEIFKQFLKDNLNYNVDNFLSDLTRKNFGNNEPNFLGKIIVSYDNEKSYENLLMYMNYLNLNRDIAIANKSYFPSTLARDGAFSGAFPSDLKIDQDWYKNKTLFLDVKKNEQQKIIDIDFNQFFIN